MEQRTQSWEQWRQEGIGSSDAPVVMGISPYMSRLELWELKAGIVKAKASNWAMERGNRLEPKARAHYELLAECDMTPTLAVHSQFKFIRASLDGFNENLKRVLEIKCPGREDHDTALNGKVPEKYIPQIQHQLLVTGAERCDYFSFDGEKGVIVPVEPDLSFQSRLVEEETAFWNLVQTFTPPAFEDRDFRVLSTAEAIAAFDSWKKAKEEADIAEEKLVAAREAIISLCKEPRVRCSGVELKRIIRKGAIDYSKIPELKGVALESYRKNPISVIDIRMNESLRGKR